MKKIPKAAEVLKIWKKTYCKRGELLQAFQTSNAIIFTKTDPVLVYKYKMGHKKKKQRDFPDTYQINFEKNLIRKKSKKLE